MPNAITTEQLIQFKLAIESGGVSAAREIYAELYSQGYNYAGWAEGVASGNTITGLSALHFLNDSYSSTTGVDLTDAQTNQIRLDMAIRTLGEYIKISQKSPDGILTRDLKYLEIRASPHLPNI